MKARIALLALAASVTLGASVQADTLRIDETDKAVEAESTRPSRGMTMKRVETRFGAPNAARPAIGDPPITAWEYGDFMVYFEYDRVIHSVDKVRLGSVN